MIEDKFLPEGFKTLIGAEIDKETAEHLFSALCGEAETSVRLNRRKPTSEPLYAGMESVGWCKSGHYLPMRPNFTLNPLLHAGTFYVQDASSMIYEAITEAITGDTPVKACDLCAAPGGKTTAILNALPDKSVMLANEFIGSRANILKENLYKYGYPEIVVTNCDTGKLSAMRNYFDIVAVDAPCSGEGMMRKDETARSQWSEGLVRQCSTLQKEILANAVEMLAPGGYLIYSTCTFNTIENEDNAAWMADNFGMIPIDTGLTGQHGITGQVKGNIPCLRFMPGLTRGEGLFTVVFRKQEDSEAGSPLPKNKRKGKGNKERNEKINPEILNLAKSWINGDFGIFNHDGHLLALTPATADLLEAIPKGVRIISAGVEIGEIKGKDLIPSHQLALSTAMAHPFPEVGLTTEEALMYLSKDTINLPPDIPKGFVTATYRGYPLGFLKNLGTRSNNLYPSEYRIRVKVSESLTENINTIDYVGN
ncbi:MAG: RsmB/NOP family class I SAM-dependent RNA methyltransferase [Muribaculaceae bacterium]|nr:RsmB/NOP family class I SAM-dependent RNA methyltransferase [Muribaculaceae bacterium]